MDSPLPEHLQPLIGRLPSDGHDIIDVSAPAEEKKLLAIANCTAARGTSCSGDALAIPIHQGAALLVPHGLAAEDMKARFSLCECAAR